MSGTRFLVAGRFIDGSGAKARRDVVLAVKDGIIAAVGSAAHLREKDGSAIDDFSHCTLLPPLVDCCTNLMHSPSVDERVRLYFQQGGEPEKQTLLERHVRDCHAHGVLGVADNSDAADMERCAKQIKSMRLITVRSSGGEYARGRAAGGDFLRIAFSSDIESGGGPCFGLDYRKLRHILQHRGGRKAVVVANGPKQVELALEAGCDAIEQGYGMGENNLRRMASAGVLWIPSVLRAKNMLDSAGTGGDVCCRFSQRFAVPGKQDPGAESFWKKTLSEQLSLLHAAGKAGVRTAVGTGSGSMGILHGESVAEEIKLFIKAGYALEEALRCASAVGAEFFKMTGLGRLCAGEKATFLITRGTVKQLPRKLSYLEEVYVNGVPAQHVNGRDVD